MVRITVVYIARLSLKARDPKSLTGIDPALIEHAILQIGAVTEGFEYARVKAGAGQVDVWLFLLAPTSRQAAETAYQLCGKALRDERVLADWNGELEIFRPDPGPFPIERN